MSLRKPTKKPLADGYKTLGTVSRVVARAGVSESRNDIPADSVPPEAVKVSTIDAIVNNYLDAADVTSAQMRK